MFKAGDIVKLNTLTHKYKKWQNVLDSRYLNLNTEFEICLVDMYALKEGDYEKEDVVCIKALYGGFLPSSMFYLVTKEIVYEIY